MLRKLGLGFVFGVGIVNSTRTRLMSTRLDGTIAPTDLFSTWADNDRDSVMADGHRKSVAEMMDGLGSMFKMEDKTILELGCGNGWVLRDVFSKYDIKSYFGVDGAKSMIEKANTQNIYEDKHKFQYQMQDLTKLDVNHQSFDLIFSMEVLYYLQEDEVKSLLSQIANNLLKDDGVFIFGIDHYYENTDCHGWAELNNTPMLLWTEERWQQEVTDAGLVVQKQFRAAKREGISEGTLVFIASKS